MRRTTRVREKRLQKPNENMQSSSPLPGNHRHTKPNSMEMKSRIRREEKKDAADIDHLPKSKQQKWKNYKSKAIATAPLENLPAVLLSCVFEFLKDDVGDIVRLKMVSRGLCRSFRRLERIDRIRVPKNLSLQPHEMILNPIFPKMLKSKENEHHDGHNNKLAIPERFWRENRKSTKAPNWGWYEPIAAIPISAKRGVGATEVIWRTRIETKPSHRLGRQLFFGVTLLGAAPPQDGAGGDGNTATDQGKQAYPLMMVNIVLGYGGPVPSSNPRLGSDSGRTVWTIPVNMGGNDEITIEENQWYIVRVIFDYTKSGVSCNVTVSNGDKKKINRRAFWPCTAQQYNGIGSVSLLGGRERGVDFISQDICMFDPSNWTKLSGQEWSHICIY